MQAVMPLWRSGLFTRRAMPGREEVLMVRSLIQGDPMLPLRCCASSLNRAGRDRKQGQSGHISVQKLQRGKDKPLLLRLTFIASIGKAHFLGHMLVLSA